MLDLPTRHGRVATSESAGRHACFRVAGRSAEIVGVSIDWNFIATAGSAVLTTLLGVAAGSFVSNRTQRGQRSWERQTDACAQVLRESAAILVALARLSQETRTQATDTVSAIDWRSWNDALAMVSLVADHAIAHAAHSIDEEIWRTHITLTREASTLDRWFALRDRIEDRRRSFTEVARRRLDVPGPIPHRLHGRPDPDDPVWALPEPPSPTR